MICQLSNPVQSSKIEMKKKKKGTISFFFKSRFLKIVGLLTFTKKKPFTTVQHFYQPPLLQKTSSISSFCAPSGPSMPPPRPLAPAPGWHAVELECIWGKKEKKWRLWWKHYGNNCWWRFYDDSHRSWQPAIETLAYNWGLFWFHGTVYQPENGPISNLVISPFTKS